MGPVDPGPDGISVRDHLIFSGAQHCVGCLGSLQRYAESEAVVRFALEEAADPSIRQKISELRNSHADASVSSAGQENSVNKKMSPESAD